MRAWACLFACAWLFLAASFAQAANPQPYDIAIQPTGTGELDDALQASALLVSLKDSAPVPPFGLIARARQDAPRLVTALHSFGYYAANLTITIAGRALDDPDLPMVLDAIPMGMSVDVAVKIDTGPLYRLRTVTINGDVPQAARAALRLEPGAPAVATDVLAAQARLLSALQEAGHPLAQVPDPVAYADDQAHVIDITFTINAGPQAPIGSVTVQGLKTVHESFVREVFGVETGDPFSPTKLEAARQALLDTGVFLGVTVRPDDHLSPEGAIPILVDVQERPAHAVKLEGTYSTDLGVILSAGWSHRNLFGNAEQLNLLASGTGLWGDATEDVGYRLSTQFIKPGFLRADQALQLDLVALKQDLRAYNQTLESAGTTVSRKFSTLWKGSIGLTAMVDRVSQKGVTHTYELISLPVTATYDSTGITDTLLDATHGLRASLAATPTQGFGNGALTFLMLQAAASAYFDLLGDGRTVLALRALVGSVIGASNLDLPPDQRLYAGGSPTVRGFRYQTIGPLFPDGDPLGGTQVDAGTVELRQRILESWGVAAFIDAGQTSADRVPFTGTLRFGAGGGLRYYTGIGAIRADIAFPINPPPNADSFELYIGLGQAF